MGKTLLGGTSHKGNISMLTPEQQRLYSDVLSQLGPDFISSFSQTLQPKEMGDYEQMFQKTFVDPALQTYERQILPAIQQRFVDANAGSSSALNQALAQSASDLSTSLGSQFGGYMQNQQQLQQNALNQFLPLLSGQTFSPMIQQRQGILGPVLGAFGDIGSGYMMSSRKVKENIRDYEKSVDCLKDLQVKQYDYIQEVGGIKDRVGFIAEDLPEEFRVEKDGVLHADLYGLLGLAINTIKSLENRISELESSIDK